MCLIKLRKIPRKIIKFQKRKRNQNKIRQSSVAMPSMKNKPVSNRSKVVKVLPGQAKPSKIQVFKKKKTIEKPKPVKKEEVVKLDVINKPKP